MSDLRGNIFCPECTLNVPITANLLNCIDVLSVCKVSHIEMYCMLMEKQIGKVQILLSMAKYGKLDSIKLVLQG